MTAVDQEVLEQIRERLQVSTRVNDERIQVGSRDGDVVLRGTVASPEEAAVATQLAEHHAASVRNELVVDRGLREGLETPQPGEPAVPPEDEELVGSTDMLAGPGSAPTEDMALALDENEPWSPPDVPQDAPTRAEERGAGPLQPGTDADRAASLRDPDEQPQAETADVPGGINEAATDEPPSAPDVSAEELRRAADHPLPSLDPDAAPPQPQPAPNVLADERGSEDAPGSDPR